MRMVCFFFICTVNQRQISQIHPKISDGPIVTIQTDFKNGNNIRSLCTCAIHEAIMCFNEQRSYSSENVRLKGIKETERYL